MENYGLRMLAPKRSRPYKKKHNQGEDANSNHVKGKGPTFPKQNMRDQNLHGRITRFEVNRLKEEEDDWLTLNEEQEDVRELQNDVGSSHVAMQT